MDVHTPSQRRRNMQAIRGKDTTPEMIVRTTLHRMGYRFRLHRKDLPGKPDIVTIDGADYYRSPPASFAYDVPDIVRKLSDGERWDPQPAPTVKQLFHKVGFCDFIRNHEFFKQYFGKTRDEILEESHRAARPVISRPLPS